MITRTTSASPASPRLSPAVAQRIESFAAEIREAASQAAYLMENSASRLEHGVLDEVRLSLEGLSAPLLEALGGKEDDDLEIYPLSQPAPYFLPMALARVCLIGRSFLLLASLAASMDRETRLATEYFATRLDYLSETAGGLRDAVLNELPPLEAFHNVLIPSTFA